jgi:exonuclease SbcC
MIISDISAANILKYAELELHDLPEKGIIAIEGPNESGKSTIGEIICFALFGQTFSLGRDSLEKLIRWGETHCSVTVRFRTGGEAHYEIARFLDRDGNQGARLNKVGEEDEPVARGTEAVENALYELLGYGYEEFIESFYLAQREITTPHPHSYAVKTMAGLSTLEYVAGEYADEIEAESQSSHADEQEKADVQQDLEELDIQPGLLAALKSQRDALNARESEAKQWMEELRQSSVDYQENVPRMRAAASARARARLLGFIVFLVAAALLAGWGLLSQMPEHGISRSLAGLLSANVPQWSEQQLPILLYAGIGFSLLFLLLWVRVSVLKGRISTLAAVAQALAGKLAELPRAAVPETSAETAGAAPDAEAGADEQVVTLAQEANSGETADTGVAGSEGEAADRQTETAPLEPLRPDDAEIEQARVRIAASQAEATEVRDLVDRILAWLNADSHLRQADIVRLQVGVVDEQARIDKAEQLQQILEACEQKLSDHAERIRLRELAGELLQGAARHLSRRFNRDLRDLVGRTLPLFTENRYEHLQIDENLDVRAFSSEKRDFMGLDEISSGTQRQIMLAVRLALSQKLVNSTVHGKQFIFLDEPFAFFDQERTRSALKVLRELSDEITQIWVVAQTFPAEQTFDLPIACAREKDVLPARG